ncbi:partner and localizer of BRCA2 [Corythoichthys intestinalis]|uniref:partner and localizer of BRCA2 n=1 Tax=Corythoichthys intestinalis TaxID=161448 RepID=UPI0025A5581F|nr:partner and localizer of BRCA2 [Corythoichthys intestinalis]XP_057700574.1 partner and localizer of BRCA2 [Corythoichthys intestinalis]XP_061791852.1 partner and localizer of BRCA2-like [Nerophis lumbriciformis]
MKNIAIADVLRCEEQLRSTLHCDDKDNLRKKLAQLRREYLKTAQKLQRAERLEAVQKHVRKEVTPKQDQTDQDGMSKSSFGGGPATSSCSNAVITPLPSTPEPEHLDSTYGCRASPALRLRSRRSRIRWQNRGEEVEKSQGEATFTDESQSSESTSPSLLLSHWSVLALSDERKEGEIEAETPVNVKENENRAGEVDGGHLKTKENNCQHLRNEPILCSVEGGDKKRLQETCTMVEGLLFPAEYYVRTTRRMALMQSQPDLRGVINTQLSSGRPRRKKASPPCSGVHSDPIFGRDTPTDSVSKHRVTRPGRSRKSRRGRCRAKPQVQRPSASPVLSLHERDSPRSHPTPEEVDSPSDFPQATSPDTQHSSQTQKIFPIFHKTVKPTSVASGSESWHSFLVPSLKLSPPLQPPLPMQLIGNLPPSDLHQDFYLPDDQFASLKLIKLCQVAAKSRTEPFVSSSHNSGAIQRLTGTQETPLKGLLALTPTAEKCSSQIDKLHSTDMQITATSHLDLHNICRIPRNQEWKCGDNQQKDLPPSIHPLEDGIEDNRLQDDFPKVVQDRDSIQSQLRLSPAVGSAPLHPPSSTLHSSPVLPSVGLTPRASSPTATAAVPPSLSLPTPVSTPNRALSPPPLSPQTSTTHNMAAPTPDDQILAPSETCRRCTLKVPAGGALVDACCLSDTAGRLCVAAAGRWAVCLWRQESSTCAWSLRHTWAFIEPVINVFPVPDASGLMCVTLGQLEVKEVRVLSCCGGEPTLLLDADIQVAVGVPKSRVVTSSNSSFGCSLQVFTLSNDGSTFSCLPLNSPGICVRALAPVDALPDALVGTDEEGQIFLWNLRNGHLLQKIKLDDSLTHSSCLRGFSCSGVFLVLLQHLSLGCLLNDENTTKDKMSFKQETDNKESTPFSLVAVNPLSGKSVLATHLELPESWSGRLCEASANNLAVVGLSHNGGVCVWQLRRHCKAFMVRALGSDGDGWQLAHWAEGGDTLVTGHHNGDVTLHFDLNAEDHLL